MKDAEFRKNLGVLEKYDSTAFDRSWGDRVKRKFTAADIWEKTGITEHEGGIYATQRLIELCGISPGQLVLDIGCGTGYTSCLLSREYQVEVVAIDVSPNILEQAKRRIREQEAIDRATTIQADAHELPFRVNTFDAAIAESVLVHVCGKKRVFSEVHRVLKPSGVFGDNELTCLKPPPRELLPFLSQSLGIDRPPLQKGEWRSVFREAGFVHVSSTVSAMNEWVMFTSHLRVDGVRKYVSAIVRGISDPTIRSTFFNKDMLRAALEFSPYVGYGLYVGRKKVMHVK